jgi:hypothetical protein
MIIDANEVRKALALVRQPHTVFEIRALEAQLNGQRFTGMVFGYFDNASACIAAVQKIKSAVGIFITVNPVDPALLARAQNRLRITRKTDSLTVDHNIERRRWLLIDVDAKRPSGISATDQEKLKATEKARAIFAFLKSRGWPEPIVADSGNGLHLLFRVDLPADDERLCENVLAALADHFDDNAVKLDRSVHNPSRIARLYGTVAGKGDDTKERPHRMTRVLSAPRPVEAVSREQLQAIVTELHPPKTEPKPKPTSDRRPHEPLTKEQVREMLAFIPKRPDYGDWIKVVAAVGDVLPDADAIQLLSEWSPEERPGEYAEKLAHRLKDVHAGSLVHLAKEHGWRPKKTEQSNAPVVHDDSEWATDLSSFTSLDEARFPAPLEDAAFYGLAGKIVRRIQPETEAHPAALLTDFLTGFGNLIGRTAYAVADGVRHYCNLYSISVGRSSTSRKGTAWKRILPVLAMIDDDWVKDNIESGLSSGEGVIHRIRNKIEETKPIREKGRLTGEYETVTTDPGVDDKRLQIIETEFCSALKVMNREGNTLSPVLRAAWDGDDLGTLTKHSRERATNPHVSLIGHITREELRRSLNEVEAANGFGNRQLWIAARRWQNLPKGGQIPAIADFLDPLGNALLFAQTCGELKRDDEAEELWARVYPELSEDKPGLLGAITSRAAAQTLRLSLIYAVLDCSLLVRVPHLQAALAVWRYAEASARWIFETGTGSKVADRILAALITSGSKGLTKSQIVHDLFNRNVTKFTIDEALRLLHYLSLAHCQMESTKGRPAEHWFSKTSNDLNDKNDKSSQKTGTYVV